MCLKENHSFTRRSFSTSKTNSERAYKKEHGIHSPEKTQDTKAIVRNQNSKNKWQTKATLNTFIGSKARTPMTFENRLRFLNGQVEPGSSIEIGSSTETDSSTTSEQHNLQDPEIKDSSKVDEAISKYLERKKKWMRFRPGFLPGDFMCPQCGSHNFRPPEHSFTSKLNSKFKVKPPRHMQQAENDASLSHPSKKSNIDPTDVPNESSVEQAHNSSTSAIETDDMNHSAETEVNLSLSQEQLLVARKYPLGAKSHCFECGYESSFETAPVTASSKSSLRAKTTTEATKDLRKDIRLVNPRDYVCPTCQTVNYNNRMYCVGCGVLAPWIQEVAESSLKKINKGNKGLNDNKMSSSR
ncbi:hypothetical protein BGZ46_002388 [Entomortierella lignicola]|nr:hypothetical protein BGZ46_002388 [Entomortierella lignicola]